jgi:hypothetical protein
MLDLVRRRGIQIFDHGIRFAPDTGYSVDAFAAPEHGKAPLGFLLKYALGRRIPWRNGRSGQSEDCQKP